MTEQRAEGVVDLGSWDANSAQALKDDPFKEWDRLRRTARAFSSSANPDWATWVITDHEDVLSAFQHPEWFSNKNHTRYPDDEVPEDQISLIPHGLDPPEHMKYRALIASCFSPARVKAMEPSIRAWCNELIDRFQADGRCEFNQQFARQFPAMIFLRMMGLPSEGVEEFLADVNALLSAPPGDEEEGVSGHQTVMMPYIMKMLEERRKKPENDITSYLLSLELDGRKLRDTELIPISFLLYLAGLDTVAGMLGLTFMRLAQHPDERARLIADPAMIPAFNEEALRYYSIVNPPRVLTQDMEFAGCPMHRGDRIILGVTAANHDPLEFDRPEVFDMDRERNRHIAFGGGPHRCLGSHLARLELRVAVEEWNKRIPDFRIEGGIEYKLGLGLYGLSKMTLVWDKP